MTTVKNIISLEMLKMEKNFIAVIEKGYPKQPYLSYTITSLFSFVEREMNELHEAHNQYLNKHDYDEEESIIKMRNEIADISNTLDYLYERLLRYRC